MSDNVSASAQASAVESAQASAVESLVGTQRVRSHTQVPDRRRSGRRKRVTTVMTQHEFENITKKMRVTLQNVHMKSTLFNYYGYVRTINEWYCKNHAQVCDMNLGQMKIDRAKFSRLIEDPEIMQREVEIFKLFIRSRKHKKFKNPDGSPQVARMGTLNSFRSAMNWYLFTDLEHSIPVAWQNEMTKMYTGLKNEEADRKQKGQLPMSEGKTKIALKFYHLFAEYLTEEGLVAANFVNTWAWQLMCRSMNVSQVTASALSWNGDCIGVQYGKTKNDTTGKDIVLKHIFANPFQPEVCT